MAKKKPLGEILTEAGLVTEDQLAAALQSQKTWAGKLGSTLVRMGFVKEEDLLSCLSSQLRLPSVNLAKVSVSPRAIQAIPHRIAEKYNVIPVALKEAAGKKSVILAMSDPTNLDALSEIQFQAGLTVRPVVATESSVSNAIEEHYLGKRSPRPRSGVEKRADVVKAPTPDERVILERGDEKALSLLEGLDAASLLGLLLCVLEEKGVITTKDLEEALKRGP